MEFGFEHHEEMFLVLPLVGFVQGECDDPMCEDAHYRFMVGWIFWSVHFDF